MANYLVAGAAGFIGSRVTQMLLDDGQRVYGIDNLNDAYDVRIKHYRLKQLQAQPNFQFRQLDISDRASLMEILGEANGGGTFEAVINLAARAGVRGI